MPEFKYVGDVGRVYPSLPPGPNGPEPGETYELKANPGDGRWESVSRKLPDAAKKKSQSKSDPAPAGQSKG